MRPNAERMSTSKDVAERLLHAIEGPFGSRNKLIKPRGTGLDCDLANADGKRDLTKSPLGDILESEGELLYALIINEQMKGGFEARAAQHDSLTRMLMAEFVRRHHLHETWRHMVPKRFLPLIAALIAADVGYDDIKPNSALLNRLLQATADWYKERNGSDVALNDATETGLTGKKALQAAAQKTDDELLAVMREGFAASAAPEDFAAMQNRLAEEICLRDQQLAELGAEGQPQNYDTAVAELQDRIAGLVRIRELGGAIDQGGRVVFLSLDAVAAALRRPTESRIEGQVPVADHPVEMNSWAQGEALEGPPVNVPPLERKAKMDGLEQPQPDPVVTSATHDLPEQDRAKTSINLVQAVTDEPGNVSKTVPDEAIVTEEPPELPPPLPSIAMNELRQIGRIESKLEWDELRPRLPRSSGISRSNHDDAFAGWHWNKSNQLMFPPLRPQSDCVPTDGEEGALNLNDWLRIELGPGRWRMAKPLTGRPSPPELDGFAHEFMLPPHSSPVWYGEQLGWDSFDCEKLKGFGSPAKPETVTAAGDISILTRAFRSFVKLRMDQFEQSLADGKIGENLKAENFFFLRSLEAKSFFTESFARYWMFILFARHNQEQFDRVLGESFFHGVIGPEFDVHFGKVLYGVGGDGRAFVQIFDPSLFDRECSGSMLEFGDNGVNLENRRPFLSTIFVVE